MLSADIKKLLKGLRVDSHREVEIKNEDLKNFRSSLCKVAKELGIELKTQLSLKGKLVIKRVK